MRSYLTGLFVVAIFCSCCIGSEATIVYSNDFEVSVGSKWSNNMIDTTPSGRKFLGRFLNDSHVFLALDNLPVHNQVTVSFDLFIIKSWDGDSGPDLWGLNVVGGSNLVLTSFRNPLSTGGNQHFPNNYPGPLSPSQTGASEIDTLGYPSSFGDSVYQLSYTFEHYNNTLSLEFFADGFTGGPLSYGLQDESWGLDNVVIEAVPEPVTICLLGLGGLVLQTRRKA